MCKGATPRDACSGLCLVRCRKRVVGHFEKLIGIMRMGVLRNAIDFCSMNASDCSWRWLCMGLQRLELTWISSCGICTYLLVSVMVVGGDF